MGKPKRSMAQGFFDYHVFINCLRAFLWRENGFQRREETKIRQKKSAKIIKKGDEISEEENCIISFGGIFSLNISWLWK